MTKRKKGQKSDGELAELAEQREKTYQRLMSERDPNALFPPWAAAKFLGLHESTLAAWRRTKGNLGPKYVRLSAIKVGYRKGALDEYVESREYASTSEDPGAPTRANRERAAR